MQTDTHTHPRYLGRTVEWGHWAITLMDRQSDRSKNYGVIVATLPFGVSTRGPFVSHEQREALKAACASWVATGQIPAGAELIAA